MDPKFSKEFTKTTKEKEGHINADRIFIIIRFPFFVAFVCFVCSLYGCLSSR